jgi:D-alanyl-lipoteichoic acid acyltransferase DltB (MBOAT superfamily)
LADGVSKFVPPVFDINYASLTAIEAWCGALSYTFQLYFDFSAYSDMAYGLSYMFGIILPINFNSPYKSLSIVDFWRRWHITLSTFLRDYLYFPLGGNRRGKFRRYFNLLATMLLGGLWHGANSTFVVWGGLHGFYLIINHAIINTVGSRYSNNVIYRGLGWLSTFFAVVIAWVIFRANSLEIGYDILRALFGGTFSRGDGEYLLGINRIMSIYECLFWLTLCAIISFFLPNAYEMIGLGIRKQEESKFNGLLGGCIFGLSLILALILLAITETRGVSEFLYFNF